MLSIHRSERADVLVDALGTELRRPADDPFAPEVVAVPSRGVERWLAQRLSHLLGAGDGGDGVCANVVFPAFTRLLDDVVAAADADYAAAVAAWDPARLVWPLLRVVEAGADEAWCSVLTRHLEGGDDTGRRVTVADKLARHFDRYGRSRPELLGSWAAGDDGDIAPDLAWQPELWRRVRSAVGVPAPAELLAAACARIGDGPRLSVFGLTRVAPARVRVLAALAQRRDVHLWLHHPSPALWQAVRESGARSGPRRAAGPVGRHPLLALGRDVRELQQLLAGVAPAADHHHPPPPRPATLLGRLQRQLAEDRPPPTRRPVPTAASDAVSDAASDAASDDLVDDTVQVHAAHGPTRQVEVLREVVLGLLERDPTLEPRDILVMCPDVEVFAPLVAAAFGLPDEPGGHPAARLPIRLADRAPRQTNPLLALLDRLLTLAAGRVTATAVLDLAGLPAVRRRFGFADDDLDRLREWAAAAGARWGLDVEHRARFRLGAVTDGTWRAALDRLLLGAAMPADDAWLGAVGPLDDVDSGDLDLVGRFAELLDRLDAAVRALSEPRPVRSWPAVLAQLVESLGAVDAPWPELGLRAELALLADGPSDGAPSPAGAVLGLADITALLARALAGRPSRTGFRTGALTVCTLVPMRSVPHRVVCLLGLDDGAFPRRGVADGDDLLARDPRTGERDPRSEDRQLFLDAVVAAQEHLVITYTGADPRSGLPVPPCGPLGELLDAVEATVAGGRERVVRHHPLQPFDPRNFAAAAPFSFDPDARAGASAARGPRHVAPPLSSTPLDPPPAIDVDLDDLVRFLVHPARGFLRQRLRVFAGADAAEPDDAVALELTGLSDWAVGDRVLRDCLAGRSARDADAAEQRRGHLPPGPLGRAVLRRVGPRVDALLAATRTERTVAPAGVEVAIPVDGQRLLTGTVPGVRPVRDHSGGLLLAVSYSTLAAKQRLAAWVRYLALVAQTGDDRWQAVTVGRRRDAAARSVFTRVTPDQAGDQLGRLVAIRDAGLREPLPLALETGCTYAERRRSVGIDDARAGARDRWQAHRFAAERDDREHVLVFGPESAFDRLWSPPPDADERALVPDEPSRFGALARLVWDPLLDHEAFS